MDFDIKGRSCYKTSLFLEKKKDSYCGPCTEKCSRNYTINNIQLILKCRNVRVSFKMNLLRATWRRWSYKKWHHHSFTLAASFTNFIDLFSVYSCFRGSIIMWCKQSKFKLGEKCILHVNPLGSWPKHLKVNIRMDWTK